MRRFNSVLTSIAILTVALAAFELADTVIEEEFRRERPLGVHARASRMLSRFLVVVIVALAVESLVAVFKFAHDEPAMLFYAASIAVGAAALLAGWAYFNRANRRDSKRTVARGQEAES